MWKDRNIGFPGCTGSPFEDGGVRVVPWIFPALLSCSWRGGLSAGGTENIPFFHESFGERGIKARAVKQKLQNVHYNLIATVSQIMSFCSTPFLYNIDKKKSFPVSGHCLCGVCPFRLCLHGFSRCSSFLLHPKDMRVCGVAGLSQCEWAWVWVWEALGLRACCLGWVPTLHPELLRQDPATLAPKLE